MDSFQRSRGSVTLLHAHRVRMATDSWAMGLRHSDSRRLLLTLVASSPERPSLS